jgi:hypothetical protein
VRQPVQRSIEVGVPARIHRAADAPPPLARGGRLPFAGDARSRLCAEGACPSRQARTRAIAQAGDSEHALPFAHPLNIHDGNNEHAGGFWPVNLTIGESKKMSDNNDERRSEADAELER